MNDMRVNFKNQAAQIHDLKVWVGQLANLLTTRPHGDLPSATEVNPKEQCQAITLRSEKEVETFVGKKESPKVDPQQQEKPETTEEKDKQPMKE